jgi:hypothetical protein
MTQARSTRFLIVGAGGRNGATGNHAARQLLAMVLSRESDRHRLQGHQNATLFGLPQDANRTRKTQSAS